MRLYGLGAGFSPLERGLPPREREDEYHQQPFVSSTLLLWWISPAGFARAGLFISAAAGQGKRMRPIKRAAGTDGEVYPGAWSFVPGGRAVPHFSTLKGNAMHVVHHKTTHQVCRFDTEEGLARFKADIEGPEDWVDGEPPAEEVKAEGEQAPAPEEIKKPTEEAPE